MYGGQFAPVTASFHDVLVLY